MNYENEMVINFSYVLKSFIPTTILGIVSFESINSPFEYFQFAVLISLWKCHLRVFRKRVAALLVQKLIYSQNEFLKHVAFSDLVANTEQQMESDGHSDVMVWFSHSLTQFFFFLN